MKRTPGEWREVTVTNTAKSGRRITERHIVAGKVFIAVVESESDYARHGYDAPGEAARGNGRLIAAAPKLLAACKLVLDSTVDDEEDYRPVLRAAIAEAGEDL